MKSIRINPLPRRLPHDTLLSEREVKELGLEEAYFELGPSWEEIIAERGKVGRYGYF